MSPSPFSQLLVNLPPQHRAALQWFADHAGETVPWPRPLPDGTLLAGKAKGIYKPAWSGYALSVRQSITGPYPDRPVQTRHDGSWTYQYYQEGFEVGERDLAFGNRGLLNCWRDVVPVGVFVQVTSKPNPRYRILGLALVAGYDDGYFYFEGLGQLITRDSLVSRTIGLEAVAPQQRADALAEVFDPRKVEDERKKILAIVAQRQGQRGFRQTLLRAYGGRCSVTGYDASDALEAAHIVPYRGPVTNHPSNGLLLRADFHTLFDYGLVAVETNREDQVRLLVSSEISETAYGKYRNQTLRLPEDPTLRPSLEALRQHREAAGF